MSTRQVAFLRSINVGGRRVKNHALIAVFEGLGLADVAAYQAAGNVIFTGDLDAGALERGLGAALDFDVPVILRGMDEVAAIAAAEPFTEAERAASAGKVQVSLLASAPDAAQAAAVLAMQSAADRLRVQSREVFWLPLGRMSASGLNVRRIERALGLQTWRSQGTLQRLVKRFGR